jgi:hypothetical protein
MPRSIFCSLLVLAAGLSVEAATVTVDCTQGQSLAAALNSLNPRGPNTVNVRGACAEWVDVQRFDRLTLRGRRGSAAITQPSTGSGVAPLEIHNSRNVVVRDLTIEGAGVALFMVNCQECRVEGSTMAGVTMLAGTNAVLFVKDVLQGNAGWAAIALYDTSTAQIASCTLEPASGHSPWWGAQVAKGSVLNISGTTIRGFGNGIGVMGSALVSIEPISAPGTDPDPTVVIEDNWFRGIDVSASSTASVTGIVRLQNNGPGGGAGLIVRDSSHLDLGAGARVLGTNGNGLAVVNGSTATLTAGAPGAAVEISGSSARDVFCDATSVISGAGLLAGATKITCPNLNSGESVPLPTE